MASKSRIYTKTGDKGETSLYGGKRVSKSHQRIVSIGTVDELNAALGIINSLVRRKKLNVLLRSIQEDLFLIGAELANPKTEQNLTSEKVTFLESVIDHIDSGLKPLTNFILPTGSLTASQTHLARSVCRRAERELIKLNSTEKVSAEIIVYFNRLSDLLFVVARYLNKTSRAKETIWKAK
jgi:cob(I)alamin adenosyltransferase